MELYSGQFECNICKQPVPRSEILFGKWPTYLTQEGEKRPDALLALWFRAAKAHAEVHNKQENFNSTDLVLRRLAIFGMEVSPPILMLAIKELAEAVEDYEASFKGEELKRPGAVAVGGV